MRVFRFDEEVSVPVSEFGSDFRLGLLTGDDSRVRVAILHLPPGGRVGRHPASAPQMLAVVAGEGTVSGGDGARRAVSPGYAVVWDPGEEHDARSDTGLTAVCIEGRFEPMALAVTWDIVVVDYDPSWPEWFETIRRRVWPAVADLAVRIDHVGSTSVPGMAAKPIIDMDIVVGSEDDVRPVIERLATIGYLWVGDLGVAGRQAFRRPQDNHMPAHHLYVVVENNKAHLDHWLLRDLLRADAAARTRYAELKRRNALTAEGDMDVYVAAKASLVAELLTKARAERGLPEARYWDPEAGTAT